MNEAKVKGAWTAMWRIHDIIPGVFYLRVVAQDTANRMQEILEENASVTKKMEIWLDNDDYESDVTLETRFTSKMAVMDFLESEDNIGWEQVVDFIYHELRFIYSEPNILNAPTFRKPNKKPVEICMKLSDARSNLIEN